MGRGDRKSKKGKIWTGSYGVTRNKKAIKARLKRIHSVKVTAPVAVSEEKPKVKRAPRKKEASAE
jgi:ribosomal small subunit protein bTHX